MAAPQCNSGDGRPAVFVGTMLQTGDTVALCDECLVPWAAAVLNAMTGVDPAPFLAAISDDEVTDDQVAAAEHAVGQGAPEASTLPTRTRKGSGRTSHALAEAGMETGPDAGTTPDGVENAPPAA